MDLPCNCDDFDQIDIDEGILLMRISSLYLHWTMEIAHRDTVGSFTSLATWNAKEKRTTSFTPPKKPVPIIISSTMPVLTGRWVELTRTYLKEQAHDWSLGFYNAADGSFTAPVDGLYEFDLQLVFTHDARFRVYLKKDGIVKDELANYTEDEKSGHHSAHLSTQLTLKKNQVIRLVVDYNNKKDHTKTTNACRINQKQVRCSFFQGRLIARS